MKHWYTRIYDQEWRVTQMLVYAQVRNETLDLLDCFNESNNLSEQAMFDDKHPAFGKSSIRYPTRVLQFAQSYCFYVYISIT